MNLISIIIFVEVVLLISFLIFIYNLYKYNFLTKISINTKIPFINYIPGGKSLQYESNLLFRISPPVKNDLENIIRMEIIKSRKHDKDSSIKYMMFDTKEGKIGSIDNKKGSL